MHTAVLPTILSAMRSCTIDPAHVDQYVLCHSPLHPLKVIASNIALAQPHESIKDCQPSMQR